MRTGVALLGGGPAALAAAFELTATKELRDRYEVTVYQRGWRLGGKCASGRSGEARRIEEHGLHLWFGFYENSFSLMRRCYCELGRRPDVPLATLEAAFAPVNDVVLYERWEGRSIPRVLHMPRKNEAPEQFWQLAPTVLDWLLNAWRPIRAEVADGLIPPDDAGDKLAQATQLAHERAAEPHPDLVDEALRELVDLVKGFVSQLDGAGVTDKLYARDDWRFFAMSLDLVAAVIAGVLHDSILTVGAARANDEDLRAWLRRHGARGSTADASPFVGVIYDLVFGFDDGDTSRPNLAAGKGIQALIRIGLTYKGSVIYKMQAGMGDAVIAPLYEVLSGHGVAFRFFHCATGLSVDAEHGTVETIEVVPQVRLLHGYDPLTTIGELPCWPSEPFWEQLHPDDANALQQSGADLEIDDNPLGRPPLVLRRGEDFDIVVLAIPPPALGAMADVLAGSSPAVADMLAHTRSVATQGVQLWLACALSGEDTGSDLPVGAITGTFAEPINTYCDMSHLLAREDWEHATPPGGTAFFCGPLTDEAIRTSADAVSRVRAHALSFFRDSAPMMWPAMMRDGSFDWNRLYAPGGAEGEHRLDEQYARANWRGSERYVTTPAGSVPYRLRAGESGYANLVLAGDWTRNGLCGGAVEAAVTAGMQAARAVSGEPARIPGLHGWLAAN